MRSLRELLVDDCQANEYSPNDDCNLEEALRESFPVVWEGDDEVHRWRIDYTCVCKIMDGENARFFSYSACKGTNQNSWEDAGYHFEGIDEVGEVYPVEVTTIRYQSTPE